MLERVAVHHLESGGLRLLRGGRPHKRALHSAFWVHGGGELDIVIAAARSLFSGACRVGAGNALLEQQNSPLPHLHSPPAYEQQSSPLPTHPEQQIRQKSPADPPVQPRRRAELIHLDFLYPSGALAFLRHISRSIPRRDNVTPFSFAVGAREYSSNTQQSGLPTSLPPADDLEHPHATNAAVKEPSLAQPLEVIPIEAVPRPVGCPYKSLAHVRTVSTGGEYESIWYHYIRDHRRRERYLANNPWATGAVFTLRMRTSSACPGLPKRTRHVIRIS